MILVLLGNVIQGVTLLFGAVNKSIKNAYCETFNKTPSSHSYFICINRDGKSFKAEELFILKVLLINLWTQPHKDCKD